MARSKNSNKKAKAKPKNDVKKQQKQQEKKKEEVRIVTMQALRELSDDDEDTGGGGLLPSDESPAWNDKAKALKQAIESGRFDQAILKVKQDDSAAFEEATLDDNGNVVEEQEADDQEEEAEGHDDQEEEEEEIDDEEDEEDEEEEEEAKVKEAGASTRGLQASIERDEVDDEDDDAEEDGDHDDDNEKEDDVDDERKQSRFQSPDQRNSYHAKALRVLADELDGKTRSWPWAETFDIMPVDPLPFNNKDPTAEGAVSIHDDLKREVTFYDIALKAVLQAKNQCADAKIPFSRPEDFFAEMVKSDGTFVGLNK
jgi:rRNA-processing protein EBP2